VLIKLVISHISSSLGQFMVHNGASQKKRNRLLSSYLFMIF